jgi:hypothetical protein
MPHVNGQARKRRAAILASGCLPETPYLESRFSVKRADGEWIDAIAFFTALYEGDELKGDTGSF